MGLESLKGLIIKNFPPEFVVIHKNYELEKLHNDFYLPIENICTEYDIPLIKTSKITEIENNFLGYDLGICIGFMEIIGKEILEIPKFGILNLHCGKLPLYRGRAPISRTIMDGNDNLIMTLHKMDEGIDSGDILLEYEIPIKLEDDVNSIYKTCCEKSSEFIIKGVEKLYSEKITGNIFSKQDISLKPKANKKISVEERKINWDNDIKTIHNLIRAITIPYPCAFSYYENKKFLFVKSEIFPKEKSLTRKNGEIYIVEKDFLIINCKNGLLKITDIIDEENKKVILKNVFKQNGVFE